MKVEESSQKSKGRGRKCQMCLSEVLTILIYFHQSHYRDFKAYYIEKIQEYYREEYPKLVSYNRFVELIRQVLRPMCSYLTTRLGKQTGIAFIDKTPIAVCHNKRSWRNKTFKDIAKRGKSSMGWFFDFKLHLGVNERGEILSFCLHP